jgi:hypothetical protein
MRALLLIAVSAFVLTACGEQKPVDPTPSPVVEAAPEEAALPDEVANIPAGEIAERLAGKWQALDDPNSILTITADTWTNDYTGDDSVHSVDAWRAFPGTEIPAGGADLSFTPTSTYIEVVSGDLTFYYEIGTIEADTFDMFYVSRGNRLAYKRIT